MFGLGLPELILILVIALLFVGPKKLPSVGASIGKAITEFKKAFSPKEDKVAQETADTADAEAKSADADADAK